MHTVEDLENTLKDIFITTESTYNQQVELENLLEEVDPRSLIRIIWENSETIATHLNTDCCHNHFVINSVSFVDGKRYNDCKKTYRALQNASDALCREQGLSVVERKDAHRVPRNLYLAEKAGEPTRYNVMRQDIDLAILRSETPRDLPRILRKMGYEVDFNPNHKYPTIKLPHDRRAVRFKTLGEEYTPQAMAQRIQQNHEMGIFKRMEIYNKRYPPVHPHYQKLRQDFRKAIILISFSMASRIRG